MSPIAAGSLALDGVACYFAAEALGGSQPETLGWAGGQNRHTQARFHELGNRVKTAHLQARIERAATGQRLLIHQVLHGCAGMQSNEVVVEQVVKRHLLATCEGMASRHQHGQTTRAVDPRLQAVIKQGRRENPHVGATFGHGRLRLRAG